MNKIFVTGHHRAGTHTAAEIISKEMDLPYIEEKEFGLLDARSFKLICENKRIIYDKDAKEHIVDYPEIVNGVVIQCPFLAHKVLDIAKIGKVYWCVRNIDHVALSMANGRFDNWLWDIMRSFRDEFPDDPIWEKLKYNGKEDQDTGFIGYATLLWQVKEYFFDTRFKNYSEVIRLEEQSYYDFNSTDAKSNPAKPLQKQYIKRIANLNDSLRFF